MGSKKFSEGSTVFIQYCYYFFVITLPLQWISLFNLDTLSFKPVHLTIVLLSTALIFSKSFRNVLADFIGNYKIFIFLFIGYLFLNFLYFVFAQTGEASLINLGKVFIYFLFFVLFAPAITLLRKSNHLSNEYLIVILSVFAFIFIVSYIYHILGLSFMAEITEAVRNANIKKLQFQIYQRVFNFNFIGENIAKGDEEFLGAPLRNTLMGVFVLFFLILKTNQHKIHSPFLNFLSLCTTIIIFFLIATSLSRSNLISLIIIILIGYFSIHNLYYWSRAKLFIFTGIILLILLFSSDIGNMFETILLRLEAIEESERLDIYDTALIMINESPFWGHGYATSVDTGIYQHQAHNLFLDAWMRLGIFGLILTLSYYGYILFQNLQMVVHKDRWKLNIPQNWIICFTVLPLFRALVSSTGDFTMIEWASLAYFFSYLQLNSYQQRKTIISQAS